MITPRVSTCRQGGGQQDKGPGFRACALTLIGRPHVDLTICVHLQAGGGRATAGEAGGRVTGQQGEGSGFRVQGTIAGFRG